MAVHPTAIIDPMATLDPSVDVGPYVVIEGPVAIGPRTRIMAGAHLMGDTRLGADNVVHPGVVIGDEPQDLAWDGAPTGVRIGDRNVFREHAEVQRGSRRDSVTEIGDDNYLMSQVHVAHNCRIGHRVILATGCMLGGHVVVDDRAFLGGGSVVHQHVRIGRLVMMRGLSKAARDLPPFANIDDTHVVRGLNRVGLRRAGFDRERIRALATAFRILVRVRRNLRLAMAEVEAGVRTPDVEHLLAFIRASERGVAVGPPRGASAADGDDAPS